ncbi:MAG: DUF4845 domain-containing protein [Desulfobacteraceae bacterium]|nr:MAG: DUF4845 domain-containing protein [Desulfobacteraceae bacterium]
MKKLFKISVFALMVLFTVIFVRPYWDKHLLQMDLEEAAIYGTKRSEGEVRSFLMKKIKEKGIEIDSEDLLIDKDERNTVHVKTSYTDEVKIAGRTLKTFQFTLEARESETKSSF